MKVLISLSKFQSNLFKTAEELTTADLPNHLLKMGLSVISVDSSVKIQSVSSFSDIKLDSDCYYFLAVPENIVNEVERKAYTGFVNQWAERSGGIPLNVLNHLSLDS
tara:strand:+ start:6305 stop:6625 length:321 start_codon:yes stop_codon:yes gene_type:complete